jgi:predicted transcriptional regulator
VTLNLTEDEERVLSELAQKKDLSKSLVMRQALRLYQTVSVRTERGETMCFVDQNGNRCDVMVLP